MSACSYKKLKSLKRFVVWNLSLLFFLANYAVAESAYNITVIVPARVTVTQPKLVLGSVAHIAKANLTKNAGNATNIDIAARRLSEVVIGDAPAPKNTIVIPGAKILDSIKSAGISTDTFGYSIPQEILIERAGYVVELDEIKQAVRESFDNENEFDLALRDVQCAKSYTVPVGKTDIKVTRLGEPAGGKVPLRIEVNVDEKMEANFTATAIVDDWRDVPVVSRAIERGRLIRPDDFQLVRLNMFNQPVDALSDATQVVGLRAKTNIPAGEMVRKTVVDIPPTMARGKKVTLLYRVPGLEASATGVAVEDGFRGQSVHIKNIKSQKIVTANVVSDDIAEVISE